MPQQQFSLNNHPCVIASFNPRSEKHGDENVPAGDIKLSTRVHSSVLDQFDPSYRSFLFRKADHEGEQQALLEGDTLTSLAKPKLAPLSLKEDWPGYRLVIGSGLDLGHPLVLTDVELSNFKIEAMEGGSVALSFSATAHPDAEPLAVATRRPRSSCRPGWNPCAGASADRRRCPPPRCR